jgi:hypothetical protein
MDRGQLKVAVSEAQRFIERANDLLEKTDGLDDSHLLEEGRVKRASLELSKELGLLRRQ